MKLYKKHKCTRCGLCCAEFPHCGYGDDEGTFFGCSQLIVEQDTTYCKLMIEGNSEVTKLIGTGCQLKGLPESLVGMYKERWKDILPL